MPFYSWFFHIVLCSPILIERKANSLTMMNSMALDLNPWTDLPVYRNEDGCIQLNGHVMRSSQLFYWFNPGLMPHKFIWLNDPPTSGSYEARKGTVTELAPTKLLGQGSSPDWGDRRPTKETLLFETTVKMWTRVAHVMNSLCWCLATDCNLYLTFSQPKVRPFSKARLSWTTHWTQIAAMTLASFLASCGLGRHVTASDAAAALLRPTNHRSPFDAPNGNILGCILTKKRSRGWSCFVDAFLGEAEC